ncbi:hypothetical protein [Caudoviricetes sp.]|nr:hypothetical protein [Caudoviricetes sp.]
MNIRIIESYVGKDARQWNDLYCEATAPVK